MAEFIKPKGYRSILNLKDTQIAINAIKDYFETNLARQLHLIRVSAPIFIAPETGLGDDLSDSGCPVMFEFAEMGKELQMVSSLAKWERYVLKQYGFSNGEGIYSEISAIQRCEITDNIHSIYVDRWDWERVIDKNDRTISTLKHTVRKIYEVFKMTEKYISSIFPQLEPRLPEEIFFLTTQELEDMYPDLTSKERETAIAREKGAVFLMKIGGVLKSGKRHDGRAPDNDDWELNGDIIFYDDLLNIPFEISSMGIRVAEESLRNQLKIAKCEERASMPFHRDLLAGRLPYTIGGEIGQSRLCMFMLRKAHIGEVQSSVWPEEMVEECEENNIELF